MSRKLAELLLVCLPIAAANSAVSAAPDVPIVVGAQVLPEWNAKFQGTQGWIGGDCAYSVQLGPARVLWLFGDTLLGSVKDGGRPGASLVNNTVGTQLGLGLDAPVDFAVGQAPGGEPAALFIPTDGQGWFWPQAPVRVDQQLFVFLTQVEKTAEPGVLAGFEHVAQWLAVVENPDDEPGKWRVSQHKLPPAQVAGVKRSWGSAVLKVRDELFVYGYAEPTKAHGQRQLYIARVAAGQLATFSAWQFRTADGWSDKPTDAAPVAAGMATECSVSALPDRHGFVLVYTENGLGDRIVGRFAAAPQGPWSAPLLLYVAPEAGEDRGLFTYAAKAHGWMETGKNELVISYCVNAWDFSRLLRDETVYRPKFVRVTLQFDE